MQKLKLNKMLLEIELDLPQSNYSITYHSSYYNQNTNELIAIWKVSSKGIGLCAITRRKATKEIKIEGNPKVRNYVMGLKYSYGLYFESIEEQQLAQITNGFVRIN
ncbi:hypothetical protein ABPG73_005288 [Tetrahymena malaccensis]